MKQSFDPGRNYAKTQKAIGYVARKTSHAGGLWPDRIHVGTGSSPAAQDPRKTLLPLPGRVLSEAGRIRCRADQAYAPPHSASWENTTEPPLMEFKTRKQIVYRINNKTACTYDVDDTPPFPAQPGSTRHRPRDRPALENWRSLARCTSAANNTSTDPSLLDSSEPLSSAWKERSD